jgi:hypothetical protein
VAIVFAHEFVQPCAATTDRLEQHQSRVNPRHDPRKSALAFNKRQMTEILAVDRQYVERQEVRPVSAKQQIVKAARSIRGETCDLPIKDGARGYT